MMDIPDEDLIALPSIANNSEHERRLFAKVTFNIFRLTKSN